KPSASSTPSVATPTSPISPAPSVPGSPLLLSRKSSMTGTTITQGSTQNIKYVDRVMDLLHEYQSDLLYDPTKLRVIVSSVAKQFPILEESNIVQAYTMIVSILY